MSDSQSGTPVATGKDVTIHAMQLTAWNGALPPPEMAKAYEEICKGAFERILVMAEQEAVARRSMTEADREEGDAVGIRVDFGGVRGSDCMRGDGM